MEQNFYYEEDKDEAGNRNVGVNESSEFEQAGAARGQSEPSVPNLSDSKRRHLFEEELQDTSGKSFN